MLSDEKAAIKRQMDDFFKKVDKRAAESAEDVMRKYTDSLKQTGSGGAAASEIAPSKEL